MVYQGQPLSWWVLRGHPISLFGCANSTCGVLAKEGLWVFLLTRIMGWSVSSPKCRTLPDGAAPQTQEWEPASALQVLSNDNDLLQVHKVAAPGLLRESPAWRSLPHHLEWKNKGRENCSKHRRRGSPHYTWPTCGACCCHTVWAFTSVECGRFPQQNYIRWLKTVIARCFFREAL